ncbi:MAG TPA: enoyl-CoA hydratase-related protein [Fimbriiglobus sp.]
MLYESSGVRVEVDDGIATLWLDFPGEPVNALSLSRLVEIEGGIIAAGATPGIEVLVVRSAKPAGFCGGLDFDSVRNLQMAADRAEFSRSGQQIFSRLASVPMPTLAFLHGPCLGAGLEFALACDTRLAVAGPDSEFGFPDAPQGLIPCWGGATRLARLVGRKSAASLLHSGQILSAREAVRCGLIDDAFCDRRSKIELRTALDRIQRIGSMPRRRPWYRRQTPPAPPVVSSVPWDVFEEVCRAVGRSSEGGEAGERKWYSYLAESESVRSRLELSARPKASAMMVPTVGYAGEWTDETAELVGRAVLRGGRVLVASDDSRPSSILDRYFDSSVKRGFATPLEAERACQRIDRSRHFRDAVFVLESNDGEISISVAGEYSFPLGLPICESGSKLVEIGWGPRANKPSTDRVSGWLSHLGLDPVVVADRPGFVVRRILYAVFDEAVRLAGEGVPIPLIDAVGAGVLPPVGPLVRLDAIGIARLTGSVKRLLPMAAVGTSFYRVGRNGRAVPNDDAGALLWDSRFAAAVSELECSVARPAGILPALVQNREIADRLEYRAINEAARCLDDDPFALPLEVDALAANGAGVFVAAGGPLAIADTRHPIVCVDALQRLAARHGPRFIPCPGLVRRALAGEFFRTASNSESGRAVRLRVA